MTVEILSPEKKIFTGEANGIQMPGISGSFEVLNNHAPLIAALGKGKLTVRIGKENKIFTITGGFVEVLKNNVSVLVEGITT